MTRDGADELVGAGRRLELDAAGRTDGHPQVDVQLGDRERVPEVVTVVEGEADGARWCRQVGLGEGGPIAEQDDVALLGARRSVGSQERHAEDDDESRSAGGAYPCRDRPDLLTPPGGQRPHGRDEARQRQHGHEPGYRDRGEADPPGDVGDRRWHGPEPDVGESETEQQVADGAAPQPCQADGDGDAGRHTEGVDVTAFSTITGQLLGAKILEGYRRESFVGSSLIDTIPTRLDGEVIPGVEPLGDEAEEVAPGMPYPHVGFGEDYIETPPTDKHGLICAVTREAIFFDRTALVWRNAQRVGEVLGLHKEKRVLDTILGAVNNYRWRGTAYDTYQTVEPWINTLADNDLEDWSNVDASEQVFAQLLDPHTGEPVLAEPRTVLVTPARLHAAARIFTATSLEHVDNQATSGTIRTHYANPMTGYGFVSSRLLTRRIIASGVSAENAATWWFHGDFKRAFAYMENWPITVTQAPPNHDDDFERDIVLKVKASERGVCAVIDPRYVVKNTG